MSSTRNLQRLALRSLHRQRRHHPALSQLTCRWMSSSSMATKASSSTTQITSSVEIPVRHSIRQLPPACMDGSELKEMTEHVLTTQVGNLFQYDRTSSAMHRDDATEAWKVADATAQMVEYLLRGHSAQIPGTLWEQWTSKSRSSSSVLGTETEDPIKSLEAMNALLERIWDEGNFYMKVRKEHLSQLAWETEMKEGEEEDPLRGLGLGFDGAKDNQEDADDDEDEWKEVTSAEESKEFDDQDDTMEDFAMPGPTVNMYDTFLDSVAVLASEVKPQDIANEETRDLFKSRTALNFLQIILYRHRLDGDDELNTNIHTLPTQISFNATIRSVANLHHDQGSELQRDWALMAAFGAFDAMTHSSLERNPMTYAYLLHIIAKYIPPCTSRGNMANGLLKMAKEQGHFNGHVLEAFLKANEPSNGSDFDKRIEEELRGKDWKTELPQTWRRRAKASRLVPRQDKY